MGHPAFQSFPEYRRHRMFRIPHLARLLLLVSLCLIGVQVSAQGLSPKGIAAKVGTREAPLEVAIEIEIDQISFVDQKSENFGVVATIRLNWHDPALAFDEAEYGREYRVMKPEVFVELAGSLVTVAPAFVIQNQQSKRWIHQAVVVVHADGNVRYLEKSSLTLQAPHFDFTRYPFDRQQFYFEIVSVFPSDLVHYTIMPESSGLGDLLGEEQWIMENARAEWSTEIGLTGEESDRVALAFEGHRHLMYYMIRIFLPMLVLIVVSWATFFLDEYRKRAEIAGANLLVFVAFNWMISDDLPKLGYLTFLDFILQWMFVVAGVVVIFSVGLSRLKWSGRDILARRLDNYTLKWVYPLGYATIVGFAVYKYLVIG